ncbi:lipoprotein, putative [Pseudoalteromonas luteoviolacea B = ATCC 29581]|nr:lipoprotein, putative [Pseudoalteromonas luteoviolacea B = ATCC 29581]
MKKSLLALALGSVLGLSACQPATQSNSQESESQVTEVKSESQDQQFSAFSAQFIEDLWKQYPEASSWAGYGKYDDIITIPNDATRKSNREFVDTQLTKLRAFDVNTLTNANKIDYRLIENSLLQSIWEDEKFKSYQWDPSQYNVAYGFANILNSRFKSQDEKYQLVLNRLQYVPDYYAAARANINTPTLEFTQLAISQNQGAFSVLTDDLLEQFSQTSLTEEQKSLFVTRFNAAKEAINGYISFLTDLEKELAANGNARSFRIGEALYEEKFAFDIQSGYTAKQMYEKALEDKARVTSEMVKITDKLWSTYFPEEKRPENDGAAIAKLIKHLSVKHVKRDEFVDEIKKQIPSLEKFVIEKDLISLDPEKPLVVRETPEYMRGFAGASISAPGPYDKKENTYYNVTPLDGMSDEQAESYLREYNHWILQILNIHEAIPGHYTQLVYSNESPSLIKSIFGNGAMIEGWAVYTERMMLEEGYGDFEPEMWLMYYKWNLRVICNTLLDYGIQVNGISKEEGLDLLMNGAFQEQAEAEGKWRRATLSQVQLTSYYSGYREIYDFREAQKQQLGDKFDLKAFHEKFLSFGSAPVKYVKELMQ